MISSVRANVSRFLPGPLARLVPLIVTCSGGGLRRTGSKGNMKPTNYSETNRAKASFDAAYTASTPHQYLSQMAAVDYSMAEQMNPFLSAAVDVSSDNAPSLRVLDIGCSYGMSSALLKSDHKFDDLIDFYESDASEQYAECVEETRHFLRQRPTREGVKVVGFDQSGPAVKFAEAADLLDGSIARNLEVPGGTLSADERALVAGCDMLFSAGTIGYVSDRTVGEMLDAFGVEGQGSLGPIAVMSILQLFDPAPIADTFGSHGFEFVHLPVQVAQRRFFNPAEHDKVMETLNERGVFNDPESDWMFADVCIAARPDHIAELVDVTMEAADGRCFAKTLA
jgi:SAM-dependent methyltransferase